MNDSRRFLGSGWAFPIVPDAAGHLRYVDGEANIDQSVLLLLRTHHGERVMRPDFGTDVAELLFEADSDQQLQRLETAIGAAILRWEPRVELEDVTAVRSEQTTIIVTVSYRTRQTNSRRSVVYPYYLEDPEALA